MEEVKKEAVATNLGVDSPLSRREEIYATLDANRPGEDVKPAVVPDSKESESVEPPVEGSSDGSSSVKEDEKKPELKQKANPDGFVKQEALHEERERRKAATLEKRRVEEALAAAKAEIERLRTQPAQDVEDPNESEEQREIRQYRAEKAKREAEAQQLRQADEKKAIEDKITKIDGELKSRGMPGFTFARVQTHEAMMARYNEGLLDRADLEKSEVWTEVFEQDVWPTFAETMGIKTKKQILDEKKALKEKANLVMSAGKAPEPVVQKDEEESLEDLNAKYLKERTAAVRKLNK